MSQTKTVPTCKPARPAGFGQLPCIKCGAEAAIRMDLEDLFTFECSSCDETFTADDLREVLARWTRVLAWIDTAPTD